MPQDLLFKPDNQGRLICSNCRFITSTLPDASKISKFSFEGDNNKVIDHAIDDLGILVRFTKKSVQILEKETLNEIETELLEKEIFEVHVQGYKYHITYKNKICQVLSIKPFALLCTRKTKSEYILQFQMQDERRGYYFGLYEFGEFEVLETEKIHILRAHEQYYIDRGWVTKDKTIVLSMRDHLNREAETENYAIIGYKWNTNTTPEKIWEINPTYSVNALVEVGEDR